MNTDLILEKVKQVLVKTLGVETSDSIKLTSKLKEELGLDSMSSLTFLMALEDDIAGFMVDPETLDASHLEDVNSITQYVALQLERNLDNVA